MTYIVYECDKFRPSKGETPNLASEVAVAKYKEFRDATADATRRQRANLKKSYTVGAAI